MRKQLLAAAAALALGAGAAQAQNPTSVERSMTAAPDEMRARLDLAQWDWQDHEHHSRQAIRHLQRELRAAGLYHGPIDGILGPRTRSAMAQFHRWSGLGYGSSMPPPGYAQPHRLAR